MNDYRDAYEKAYYYYQLKTTPFHNQKMEDFIEGLNQQQQKEGLPLYTEKVARFPLEVSEREIIVYFPKENAEVVGDGLMVTEALVYDYSDATYTKIYSQYGIRETFNQNHVSTSHYLLDGYMALEFRESAKIDFGTYETAFLHLHAYDEELFSMKEEVVQSLIQKHEEEFDILREVASGNYDAINKLK